MAEIKQTRREARAIAMQVLYTMDVNTLPKEFAIDQVCSEEFPYTENVEEFVNNTVSKLEEIDALIESSLVNYKINRLNLVDKAIIRVAVGELLAGVDKKIAINEAVELTKEFTDQGDHKACAFNNKLLETISTKITK